jgi:hypothetical protein
VLAVGFSPCSRGLIVSSGASRNATEEDETYFRERTDIGRYAEGQPGNPGERAVAAWRYYVTLTGALHEQPSEER